MSRSTKQQQARQSNQSTMRRMLCQHLFAVGGLHPASLYAAHVQLVVDVLVFVGELLDGVVGTDAVRAAEPLRAALHEEAYWERLAVQVGNGIDFVAFAHGVAGGDEVLAAQGDAAVVVQAVGQLVNPAVRLQTYVIDRSHTVPHTGEEDALRIAVP